MRAKPDVSHSTDLGVGIKSPLELAGVVEPAVVLIDEALLFRRIVAIVTSEEGIVDDFIAGLATVFNNTLLLGKLSLQFLLSAISCLIS